MSSYNLHLDLLIAVLWPCELDRSLSAQVHYFIGST